MPIQVNCGKSNRTATEFPTPIFGHTNLEGCCVSKRGPSGVQSRLGIRLPYGLRMTTEVAGHPGVSSMCTELIRSSCKWSPQRHFLSSVKQSTSLNWQQLQTAAQAEVSCKGPLSCTRENKTYYVLLWHRPVLPLWCRQCCGQTKKNHMFNMRKPALVESLQSELGTKPAVLSFQAREAEAQTS